MKAVILAAGRGSRLGQLTESIPKPLLEYHGIPILFRHIDTCIRHSVSEIFINTHHLSELLIARVEETYAGRIALNFSREEELLGTAGALNNFRDALGDGDFAVIYGDNIIEYDMTDLHESHRRHEALATIVGHYREDVSMSGVMVFDENGRLEAFMEKPAPDQVASHIVSAGLYVLGPRSLDYVLPGASDFGADVFPAMLRNEERLFVEVTDKEVTPIDTLSLYESAMRRGAGE